MTPPSSKIDKQTEKRERENSPVKRKHVGVHCCGVPLSAQEWLGSSRFRNRAAKYTIGVHCPQAQQRERQMRQKKTQNNAAISFVVGVPCPLDDTQFASETTIPPSWRTLGLCSPRCRGRPTNRGYGPIDRRTETEKDRR